MTRRTQSKRRAPAGDGAPADRAGPNYPGTLQENLLAALCHHEAGREVANLLNPALFEGDYRLLAERAIDYWKQYDRPPGPHSSDLLSDILESKHDRRGITFRSILVEMLRLADSDQFNVKYILDDIKTFHQRQSLLKAMLGSVRALQTDGDAKAAIARVSELFAEALQDPGPGRLIARPASAFEPREVRWMRRPFFMRRAINLITGEGGVGKTLIAIDAAARRSRKGEATLYLTVEDEPGELRPRMVAARGDPDRLLFLGEDSGGAEGFDLIDSLAGKFDQIEQIIADRGDVGMVVIDPFVDFSGRADHYNESEVRQALKPLRKIAQDYDLAAVIIVHFNKKQDLSASGRTSGSMAFRNVPRSVMVVVPDPDEPGRTLMIQNKFNKLARDENNAAGFTTTIRQVQPAIVWEKELFRLDADDVLRVPVGRPSKQEDAVDLLRDLLADGPVAVAELQAAFGERDISWATAQKVKDEVPVQSFQKNRRWYWGLA